MEWPSAEGHDLWKQVHVQIDSLGSAKHKKFVSMLKWHLRIKGDDDLSILKIAPYHFGFHCFSFVKKAN